jgi:hypothetical protein
MSLTRDEVLREMEQVWRDLQHELLDMSYDIDWKRDPQDPESWSARDILSHLMGTEEGNALAYLKHALKADGTEKRLEAGNPVRVPERRDLSMAQLVTQMDAQVTEMRGMVQGATSAQLEATSWFVGGSGSREQTVLERAYRSFHNHMREHTEQVKELRRGLGSARPA